MTIMFHKCDICNIDDYKNNIEIYPCTEKTAKVLINKLNLKDKDFEDFHICKRCIKKINFSFQFENIWGTKYVEIKGTQ